MTAQRPSPNAAGGPAARGRFAAWLAHARRFGPLAALLAIAVAAYFADLPHVLSPAALGARQDALRAAAAGNLPAVLGGYVVVYAVLTGACLPVAMALTLAGGVVFGVWLGGAATLVGATSGALLTYGAARSAFAHALVSRAERDPRLQRLVRGFGDRAFSSVLTLRLIPMFPFSLVNVAAGLAAAPVRAFVLASLLGGLPSALIYSSLGAGLGQSLGAEGSLAKALHSPTIILPLAGLAVLSVAPIAFTRLRRRGGAPPLP